MKWLQNFWLKWPFVDVLLPVIFVLAWNVSPAPKLDRAAIDLILTALAAAGGLVMAVATFAAGMMYQSVEAAVTEVRTAHSVQLRGNWTWIICSLLVATLTPIVGMALTKDFSQISICAALVSLALIVSNLVRVVYLLRMVLFLTSYPAEQHKPGTKPKEKF